MMTATGIFVGADGCKAGWFAVILTEGQDWKVTVFPDIFSLWKECSNSSVILLDIPIGLREEGTQERLCDIEARKLLGPKRRSSVFPVPCRPSIKCLTYKKASDINEQRTGRQLSRQIWNIVPKIREVDRLLSNCDSVKSCIRETHPEICFWAMAGHPMEHSKKKVKGYLERMQILQSVYLYTNDIINHALSTYKRKEVARDDILDALAAAVTAAGGVERLVSIPEVPEFDSQGLRMEIVYRHYPECEIA